MNIQTLDKSLFIIKGGFMEYNREYIDEYLEQEIERERWRCREIVLRERNKCREIVKSKTERYRSIIISCIVVIVLLIFAIQALVIINTMMQEHLVEIVQALVDANNENVELQNLTERQSVYINYLYKLLCQ